MISISFAEKICNSSRENSSFKLLCHFVAYLQVACCKAVMLHHERMEKLCTSLPKMSDQNTYR